MSLTRRAMFAHRAIVNIDRTVGAIAMINVVGVRSLTARPRNAGTPRHRLNPDSFYP
ncbi:MAG: hypothetical protein R3A47_03125 [Polyangiales bacterium]